MAHFNIFVLNFVWQNRRGLLECILSRVPRSSLILNREMKHRTADGLKWRVQTSNLLYGITRFLTYSNEKGREILPGGRQKVNNLDRAPDYTPMESPPATRKTLILGPVSTTRVVSLVRVAGATILFLDCNHGQVKSNAYPWRTGAGS